MTYNIDSRDFVVVTTPTVSGYRITEVLGIVSGLSPRTRGVGGVLRGHFSPLEEEGLQLLLPRLRKLE